MKKEILFNVHWIKSEKMTKEEMIAAIGVIMAANVEDDYIYLNIKDAYVALYDREPIKPLKMKALKQGLDSLVKKGYIEKYVEFNKDCYELHGVHLYRGDESEGFWFGLMKIDVRKILLSNLKSNKNLLRFFIILMSRRDAKEVKSQKYKYKFVYDSIGFLSKYAEIPETKTYEYLKSLEDMGLIYIARLATIPNKKVFYKSGNIYCAMRDKDLLIEFLKKIDKNFKITDPKAVEQYLKVIPDRKKESQKYINEYISYRDGYKDYDEDELKKIYRAVEKHNKNEDLKVKRALKDKKNYTPNYYDTSIFDDCDFVKNAPEEGSDEWFAELFGE